MGNKKVVGLLVVLFTLISVAVAFAQAPPPPPIIMATPPTSTAAPAAYSFNANWSGGTIAYVNWDFGDGSGLAGSLASPNITGVSHTYSTAPAAGNAYKVMAMVYSNAGGPPPMPALPPYFALVTNASSPIVGINITPPPSSVAPASFTFQATTSSGTIAYTNWNFSDSPFNVGTTGASITHTFSTAGTFFCDVIEVDLSGGGFLVMPNSVVQTASSSPAATIIGDAPLTPNGANPQTGQIFQFSSVLTGGTASSVTWNFGDGTTNSVANTHSYSANGTYNVTATITPTSGPALTSQPIPVQVGPSAPPPSSAALSGTITGTSSNSTWTGSGSYTASASSTTWSGSGTFNIGTASGTWTGSGSFSGAGGSSGTWSGSGSWSTPTNSGTWSGSGSWSGTTSGTWTGSGTFTQTAGGGGGPAPMPFITITPPASTTAPVPYSFGVQWPGQIINYVNWNFGDGTTMAGSTTNPNINVSHTYNAPTVGNAFKVTATTDSGATTVEFALVTSASTPTVNLVVTPPASAVAPTSNYTFQVTTSSGTISSVLWRFKDGMNNMISPTIVGPITGATETYAFPYASTWEVKTVEVDLSGGGFIIAPAAKIQTAAASPAVTIIANSSPQPIMTHIGPILPITGTLTAQLSGGGTISSVVWNFGDGSPAGSGTSTTHTYSVAGNYYVNATVTPTSGAAIVSQNLLLDLTGGGAPPPPPPPPGGGAGVPNILVIAPASPVAPATYSFTANLPNDTISSVSWNFADGSPTGTGVNINHTFTVPSTAPGNVYNVLATMIDVAGATYTAQAPVTVTATAQPTAFINLTLPANLVAPTTYSFTAVLQNDGSNTISSVNWDFGDGSPFGSGTSATHTYNTAGNFIVTATITDSASKSFFSQATASVFSSTPATSTPIGWIGVTPPAPPPAPQFFSFTANLSNDGSNTISSVAWNFGDGTTGTGANASHTYNVVGNFNVTATIIDSANHSISATAPIFLNAPPPPTAPPFISFTFPTNGVAPTAATLQVNNVSASNSSTETWDFNDPFNPSTNIATGVVAGATVNHTFTRPGTYFVQATFTFNGAAAATTIYQPISIGSSVLPTGAPPIPSMTPVSGAIAGSTAVTFSLTNAIAAYWLFGDGSPITGQAGASPATITTTHTYQFAGTFNVMIFGVGSDPTMGTFKIFMPMQVSVLPGANTTTPIITFEPNIPNAGAPVTLSVLNATSASWTTLGDGSVGGNGLTITHTYPIPGSYNVTVTGTDTSAAHNSFSKTATLIVYPPFAPTSPVNLAPAPPPLPLINLSSNGSTTGSTFFCNAPGINGKWSFGDTASGASNTATGNIASHQYNTAGNFTISYTANDPLGNQFTLTQLVVIGAATAATTTPIAAAPINTPNIGITMAPSGSLANGIVTFPSLPLTVSTANWDFGDGNTDTGLTPSKGAHTYTQAGNYIVKVTGTTTTGGTFNVSTPINIINIIQAAGVIAPIITVSNVANATYASTTAQLITNTASIPFTTGGTTTTFTSNATTTTTAAGFNSLAANVTGITATGGITGLAGATITAASTNLTASAAPIKFNVTLPPGSNDQVVWNFGNGTRPVLGANPNFTPSIAGNYHPICTFTDPTTGKQSVVQMPDITIAAPANAPTFLTPTIDKSTPTAGDVVTVNATLTGITSAVAYYRLNIDGKHRRIIKASEGQGAVGLNLRHRFEIATTHNIIVEAVLYNGTVIQSPTLSLTATASATPPTITAGLTGGLVTYSATTPLTQGNTTTFTFTPTDGTGSGFCDVLVDYGNGVKHGKKAWPSGTPITFTTPPLSVGAFTPKVIVTNSNAAGAILDGVAFTGQTLYVNAPTTAVASIDSTNLPKNVVAGTSVTIPVSTANDGTNSTKGLQFRNGTTGGFTTIPPALITTTTAPDGSTLLSVDPASLITLGLTAASSTTTTSFQIQATDNYTAGSSTGTTTSAPVNLNLTTSTNVTAPPDIMPTTDSSGNKKVNQNFDKDKDLNANISAGSSSGGTAGAIFGISAPGGSVATASAASQASVAVTNYGNTAPTGVTPPDASLLPSSTGGGSLVASYFSADYTYTDAAVNGGAPVSTQATQQTSISISLPDNGDGTCTLPSGDKCNINTVAITHQNPDTKKMELLSNPSVSESSDKKTVFISGNTSSNSPFALAGLAIAAAAGGGGAGGGAALGALAAVALCGTTGFDALIALGLVLWMNRYLRRRKMQRQQVK